MADAPLARSLPMGAEVTTLNGAAGTHVRIWAPGHERVDLVLDADGRRIPLEREPGPDGYWSAFAEGVGAGDRYRLGVDGRDPVPDPASRFQPEGPHGPSEVVDPAAFPWSDEGWPGPSDPPSAAYELHVGAFTREGTLAAAATHLPDLADLGIDVVELLPLGDFPGRFGWGYDGVDLFAPSRLYGRPDDLRRFVDEAHRNGIAVILDVVYNHVGPDGCFMGQFSDAWFSRTNHSEWGDTFNFDEPGSGPVRAFVLANVRHWIAEYHLDGLRLDATQQIFDTSAEHILIAIGRAAREAAAGRRTWVVAENEPQDGRLVRPVERGGYGLDALWNDDLHHAAVVALTGRSEAYFSDYEGTPHELVAAARHGYLFQGQRYAWQEHRRGRPALDLAPARFVAYLENHDQVANSGRGDRLAGVVGPGQLRAATAYLLLGPETPLLFMGQEWGASAPWVYFADHGPDLARLVHEGRRDFLAQFPDLATPEGRALVPDPADPAVFGACRLDHAEKAEPHHAAWLALHRDLLAVRRASPVFAGAPGGVDGAVLSDTAFLLRFFAPDAVPGTSADERLLVVNLGARLTAPAIAEPLLAPPAGCRWRLAFTTDDPRYGGEGTPEPESDSGWAFPAHAAVLLAPEPDVDPEPDAEPAPSPTPAPTR